MPDWMTKRRLAVWIALPLVLGAAIVVALLFAPIRTSAPSRNEGPGVGKSALASLQAEATEACKCARVMSDAKGMQACWSHFNKRVEKLPRGMKSSACDPVAEQGMCFGNGDCVVTGFEVKGKGGLLCTREEARTAEAIWNAAVRRRAQDKAAEDPDAALARAVDALARGDPVERAGAAAGCIPPPVD
jgi:hypothetical protein